jgi:PAS domain S-box-containing protein
MRDDEKTCKQLLDEVQALRARLAEMEKAEAGRTLAMASMRDREETIRPFLEAVHLPWWSRDLHTNQLTWSDTLCAISGCDPSYFGGTFEAFIKTMVHPDDRWRLAATHDRVVHGSKEGNAEIRLLLPDGRVVWHHTRPHVFFDPSGTPVKVLGLVLDITERKRAEESLRESEARFRAVLRNAPLIVFNQDRELRYTWLQNPRDESAESYVLGKTDFELFDARDAERVTAVKRRVLETGVGVRKEFHINRHDRDYYFDFTAEPLLDGKGKIVGLTGVAMDITEIKRAQAALQESEVRFQAFMDNSPAISFMKDEQGRYVYISQNTSRAIDKTPEHFLGRTDFDLWPTETAEQVRANDTNVLSTGKLQEVIESVPGPDGVDRYFLSFKFPFRDGSGKLLLGGVAVDVTERRRAEERQKEYAERLRAMSHRLVEVQEEERRHLARELHDEVGQALTSLRFALEGVGSVAGEAAHTGLAGARELLAEILSRIRGLSSDLRPALLDHLGLPAALQWLIERFTQRTRVQVNFKYSGLNGRLPQGVETAAYRVVQEGLTNVARHAGVAEATVRLWVDDDVLEVQVEDAGCGFDPGVVAASAASSGGLLGMYERTQLLGGNLLIDSTPGGGTHLLAQFPLGSSTGKKSDDHFHRLGR